MILRVESINSVKNTAVSKISKFYQNPLIIAGFWLCSIYSAPAFAEDCTSNHIDQYAIVKHVYDGDTVKLGDGKKVRLIGINAPEMNYKTGTPEPYAKQAKRFLKQTVLKQRIGLRYGEEKKDRYGRLLAHIFLNKLNLQQALLSKGLATNISIPPNLWQQDCYLNTESKARLDKKGLWKNHHKQVIHAERIKPSQTGFQFIKGTIQDVRQNKKTTWLKLSEKLSLRINKANYSYFKGINFKQLKGQRVVARGWVRRYKKRFYLTISHPNSLQLSQRI